MGWGSSLLGGIISGIIKPIADEISAVVNELDATLNKPEDESERQETREAYKKKDESPATEKKQEKHAYTGYKRSGQKTTAYRSGGKTQDGSSQSYDNDEPRSKGSNYTNTNNHRKKEPKSSNSFYDDYGKKSYSRSSEGQETAYWEHNEYRYVENANASLRFGKPDFRTYEKGLRGMSFPYLLNIPFCLNKDVVVTGQFSTMDGTWIKSLVPGLANAEGELFISEKYRSTKSSFEVESYLFVPFGVLDLKTTQSICLNLNVFVVDSNRKTRSILAFAHTFEYFIYDKDPREPENAYSGSNTLYEGSTFEALIGLISNVIKADGAAAPEEIRTVIDFFDTYKLKDKELLKKRLKYNLSHLPDIDYCCEIIKKHYSHTQTLLTFVALFLNIAVSDGSVPAVEINMIEYIAIRLGISKPNFDEVKTKFLLQGKSLWSLFDLMPGATQDQLRRAYKEKCKQYHPDKYETCPPEMRKMAEDRFKDIQIAYEELLKEFF